MAQELEPIDPKGLQQIPGERYYDGQPLEVADFERASSFHVHERRLMTRLTFTPGVALGLVVKSRKNGRVHIGPGVALDPEGRHILLVDSAAPGFGLEQAQAAIAKAAGGGVVLDLSANAFRAKSYRLGIQWGRAPDPAHPKAQSLSVPHLTLTKVDDPVVADSVVLAEVKVTGKRSKPASAQQKGAGTQKPALLVLTTAVDTSMRVSTALRNDVLPQIPADRIAGVAASKIDGLVRSDQIAGVAASKIDGLIPASQISGLPTETLGGNQPLLLADYPVITEPRDITLRWREGTSDTATIIYADETTVKAVTDYTKEQAGPEEGLVDCSCHLHVNKTTVFTLSITAAGSFTSQSQMTITLAADPPVVPPSRPTPTIVAQYLAAHRLNAKTTTIDDFTAGVVDPTTTEFGLQTLTTENVVLLVKGFKQAGFPMDYVFRGLSEYYDSQGWDPSQYTKVVLGAYEA